MQDSYQDLETLVEALGDRDVTLPQFFSTASGEYLMYEQISRCYLDNHRIPNFRLTFFDASGRYLNEYLRNTRGIGDALISIPDRWLSNAFRKKTGSTELDLPNSQIPPDLNFKRFMNRTSRVEVVELLPY